MKYPDWWYRLPMGRKWETWRNTYWVDEPGWQRNRLSAHMRIHLGLAVEHRIYSRMWPFLGTWYPEARERAAQEVDPR